MVNDPRTGRLEQSPSTGSHSAGDQRESGLNDVLALPVLLLVISLASAAHGAEGTRFWIWFGAMQIVLGPFVGIAVGFLGGKLVQWGQQTGWMNHSFQQLAALGLAVLSYSTAELVGGNGFIGIVAAPRHLRFPVVVRA